MPRQLCVGNGNLLVDFDENLNIRDIYFPFVGMENHVNGHFCRLGVWVDGTFSWINETWEKKLNYKEDSLVTEVSLKKPELNLELLIEDCVHNFHNVLLRKIRIRNTSTTEREIKLYFSHDLHLIETDGGITAYYHPELDAIVHFKKNRYFLIGGVSDTDGLDEFAVGVTEFGGLEGTWKDAEDGRLSNNLVAHGSVDSVVSLKAKIAGRKDATVYSWIAAGRSLDEISELSDTIKTVGPERLVRETGKYFENWAKKSEINFGNLPAKIVTMFKRSLLILRTQIDNRGGIIASSDSDILRFNKDTYSYVWPRDGAFVSLGLDAAGYFHVTQRFFNFCGRAISKEGCLYQKYHPDGSWGSTWHPWSNSSRQFQLPIQEDETALVLFSLWNHYYQARDIEFISPLYKQLICKAADFLVKYRDPQTRLPLASYDLWEENRGVSTFTCSAVFGGLKAASKLAGVFGDIQRAEKYDIAASEVKDAILKHLYDDEKGRFLKMLKPDGKNSFIRDTTVDSSVYGVFEFGVLPADDVRVEKTMRAVESALWVKTNVGGVARYQNDYYQQVSRDIEKVPGNPWFICTLWLAEWYIARSELDKGLELLNWIADRASESGVLAEQIHPFTNEPLSVSPLTWSHSTFVLTVIEYLNKLNELKICEKCGLPIYRTKQGRLW
ncbi:MAG TPA: glycoside hydrolase family 15 protein [Candidatus Bathyarchaeota archaeon]|nr:glycoside hydrolase family 15 protein [Candidatus Bathyarchaeota archaeon]